MVAPRRKTCEPVAVTQPPREDRLQDRTAATADSIASTARQIAARGPAPVHLWDPPFCGDLDMRIARDGTWFYNGTPIGREGLVRLFSGILKREGEDYFLVTPVEKVGLTVETVPFVATDITREGAALVRSEERRVGKEC